MLDDVEQEVARVRTQDRAQSPYLRSRRAPAPTAYRSPLDAAPPSFDHEHALDPYTTEDEHEMVYCTLCGGEW